VASKLNSLLNLFYGTIPESTDLLTITRIIFQATGMNVGSLTDGKRLANGYIAYSSPEEGLNRQATL